MASPHVLCGCGRLTPLAGATFVCDAGCFELVCERCSSELLDPAGGACPRCNKAFSSSACGASAGV
jgi:hypothetical protein